MHLFLPLDLKIGLLIDKERQPCIILVAHFLISIIQFHILTTLSLSLNKTEKGRVTKRTVERENNHQREKSNFGERRVKFLCTYLKSDRHSHAKEEIKVTN